MMCNFCFTLACTVCGVCAFSFRVVEKLLGASEYDLSVKSNGEVSYTYPVNQVIPCLYIGKAGLQCSISIESWAMAINLLTIKTGNPKIDTSLLGTYYDKRYKIKGTLL